MKLSPHRLTPALLAGPPVRTASPLRALGLRGLVGRGKRKEPPNPSSALPPRATVRGYTSMYFGENQLSPRSIGISPLATAHPRDLQLAWVQTSTGRYSSFILAMASSRGFGSTTTDSAPCAPLSEERKAQRAPPSSDSLSLRHRSFVAGPSPGQLW